MLFVYRRPIENRFMESNSNLMSVDVHETDNDYIIEMDVPGYTKEDIKMSLDHGYLTVHAYKNEGNEYKGESIVEERYHGECMRKFRVADDVTEEDIKASCNNGVLTIVVSKKENARRYIEIQ